MKTSLHITLTETRRELDKRVALLDVLDECEGPGIVYVGTTHAARELCAWLAALGVTCARYERKMAPLERSAVVRAFERGDVRVLVATKRVNVARGVRWIVLERLPRSATQPRARCAEHEAPRLYAFTSA